MRNILIIGGAGYVGTKLTYHLLNKNHRVTVLDRFIYNHQFSIQAFLGDPNYTFLYGDLGNQTDLAKISDDVTDVVILGGLVGDPITKQYPAESNAINSIGIRKCIDYFEKRSIDKLIFVSTCSNYGLLKDSEIADENHDLAPLSLYAKAKVEAEHYLLNKKGKTKYTGVILRFATAFGLSPRMRFDLTVNEFTRDLYLRNKLIVFDEHTWRPYCHVSDLSRIIELVISSENSKVGFEVFNVGGENNNLTKQMIIESITNHIPNSDICYKSNGSDPRNYRVSFDKVKSILGFEPIYSVNDGIEELIDAMKLGLFHDSLSDPARYGNYKINYAPSKMEGIA